MYVRDCELGTRFVPFAFRVIYSLYSVRCVLMLTCFASVSVSVWVSLQECVRVCVSVWVAHFNSHPFVLNLMCCWLVSDEWETNEFFCCAGSLFRFI